MEKTSVELSADASFSIAFDVMACRF